MLSLAVKQDIDRRVETEALKILDKIFEERLEVLLLKELIFSGLRDNVNYKIFKRAIR